MSNRSFFSNPNGDNTVNNPNIQIKKKNSSRAPKYSSKNSSGYIKSGPGYLITTSTTTTTTTAHRFTTSTTTTTTTVQTILDIHPANSGMTIPRTITTVNVYLDYSYNEVSVFLVNPDQAIINQNTFFQVITPISEGSGLFIYASFTASESYYILSGYPGSTASMYSDGTVWITD